MDTRKKKGHASEMWGRLRVGQTVRTNINGTHSGTTSTFVGYVGEKTGDRAYIWQDIKDGSVGSISPKTKGYKHSWCIGKNNRDGFLEIIKGMAKKPKKVNFLLKYDLEEDPVEEFETLAQVEARIKELVDDYGDDLDRDTMMVYEVKNARSITVKTEVVIKGLK